MKEVRFHSGDGESTSGSLYEPAGSGIHPTAVFTHGLLSARQEFGDYPERLAALGYVTLAIDLRGHGTSDGLRGFVSQARGVQDIRAALDFLCGLPTVDATRLALVGHSLGAALSVVATATDPRVRVLVAIAPPSRIRDELKPGEGLLYSAAGALGGAFHHLSGRHLYVPYRVGVQDIYHHREAREAARRAGFLQARAPVITAAALMKGQDSLAAAAHIHVPTLVMRAEHDQVVTTARKVFDAIPAEKQFVQIDDSGHSIMMDGHGAEAFQLVADWLARYL